jgi:hypothetical protein
MYPARTGATTGRRVLRAVHGVMLSTFQKRPSKFSSTNKQLTFSYRCLASNLLWQPMLLWNGASARSLDRQATNTTISTRPHLSAGKSTLLVGHTDGRRPSRIMGAMEP